MIRFFHSKGSIGLFYLLALTAILIFCCPDTIYGQDNAETMSLTLYTDQAHPDLKYDLGEPIQLIMVIKNISGYPVHTRLGFSQTELHRSLLLTDPGETRHALDPEVLAFDPPAQPRLGDQDVSPAETLPADWVRSVTIDDLGELFPIMKTMPGWHTVVAHQSFISFGRVILTKDEGLFGVVNHADNKTDPISSNSIQIQIVPAGGSMGGSLQVQVLDGSFVPPQPLGNVRVRLYKTSNIAGYELSHAWEQVELALVKGFTDLYGKWDSGCQPEDDYTAIAYHQNQYQKGSFEQADTGWAPGCSGLIEKQIVFGIGYQPKMYKQQAIDFLSALLETANKNDKKRIDKAITRIDKSLGGDLWEDDSHLTKKGKEVFDKEKKAVKELMKVKHLDVTNAIDSILSADALLAQTAIDEAITAGGDQKEIDKANKEMNKGRKEIDKGKYDKAIDRYKKAWEHAQKSLKKL